MGGRPTWQPIRFRLLLALPNRDIDVEFILEYQPDLGSALVPTSNECEQRFNERD